MLRTIAAGLAETPLVGRTLARARRGRGVIIMMHRFRRPDSSYSGHELGDLRRTLTYLRKVGAQLVSVDTLIDEVARAASGETGAGHRKDAVRVAFTIDDGYADLWEVAAPVFAEFDCPATGFVVPEVVDGLRWYWWDQLYWLMSRAARPRLELEIAGAPFVVEWQANTLLAEHQRLCERVKHVPTATMGNILRQAELVAEVPLPMSVPDEFRVLSWEELRAAERHGLQFGAHTMTHPILSQCEDDQASWEIGGSVDRVRRELRSPSRIFCFPNGRWEDFSERDMRLVRESGALAALTSSYGRVGSSLTPPEWERTRWSVPRTPFSADFLRFARSIFG
jgi:peptidoglycan/xylan/chitin deacetylase (PgdA/CDA1 family)